MTSKLQEAGASFIGVLVELSRSIQTGLSFLCVYFILEKLDVLKLLKYFFGGQ